MTKPIGPDDVAEAKTRYLPPEVIEVFNTLIAKHYSGSHATVMQEEASRAIAVALDISVAEVFKRKLLDIESVYKQAGWEVKYDKPGDYEASFGSAGNVNHGRPSRLT